MDARANSKILTDDQQFAALEAFFEQAQPSVPSAATPVASEKRPTAFVNSFSFAVSALNRIKRSKSDLRFEVDQVDRVVTLNVPDDFRERTPMGAVASAVQPRFMPPEAAPEDGRIRLTDNRGIMNDHIRKSRLGTEGGWHQFQYLWDVHPIVDWLADKVSGVFGRGSAPVARLRGLKAGEAAFVFNVVPNLKGHPLVDEWPVVLFRSGDFASIETAPAFVARSTRTGAGFIPRATGEGGRAPIRDDRVTTQPKMDSRGDVKSERSA